MRYHNKVTTERGTVFLKRILSLIFSAVLLLSCCACGQASVGAFRELEVVGTKQYGVICRKDDKIAPIVNAAVNYLAAAGTLDSVCTQWLGTSRITLDGDAEALTALELEGPPRTLIIGVEADFNPMAFQQNGELVGMSIDIGNYIGYVLNWPVVFQPIMASDVGAQLASGNIDCALGFDPGLVSASKYDIGVTYMQTDILLAVRTESEAKNIKALKGQRIGITDDSVVQNALRTNEKVTKYASGATVYLSAARCFDALDSGWCAAVAMDELRLIFFQQN